MAVIVTYNAMNLNFGADNAGIANGQNQAFAWNSHLKQAQCLRLQGVLCPTPGNFNFVDDSDIIDYPIFDNDFSAGNQGQWF